MSLQLVTNWYQALGRYERDLPLILLNDMAYTPEEVLKEVKDGTPLGAALQGQLEKERVTLQASSRSGRLWELAKTRIVISQTRFPTEVHTWDLDRPVITSQEIIEEVKRETELGKGLIRAQIEFMSDLVRL